MNHLSIPEDGLAALVDAGAQREAAARVEAGFAQAFRLSVNASDSERAEGLQALQGELESWVAAAADEQARALRLAMLLSGLDQWGLAWSQAFGLVSIAGLSELVSALRHALDARAEALLLQRYGEIDASEGNLVDFKLGLRRGIHLALWHAAIACDSVEEAEPLLNCLGGLMLGLARNMPELGWRLVADTLAFVQIRCLDSGLAESGVGQQVTQSLLASLAREFEAERWQQINQHAAQALLAWQQERRARTQPH